MKENDEELAVGLIRGQTHKLLVNPHPDLQVNPGDRLIYIAPASAKPNQIGYEQDEFDNSDFSGDDIEPSAEAEELFRRGLKLFKQDENYEEAYQCFHQAAIQNHTRAKYNLPDELQWQRCSEKSG